MSSLCERCAICYRCIFGRQTEIYANKRRLCSALSTNQTSDHIAILLKRTLRDQAYHMHWRISTEYNISMRNNENGKKTQQEYLY